MIDDILVGLRVDRINAVMKSLAFACSALVMETYVNHIMIIIQELHWEHLNNVEVKLM